VLVAGAASIAQYAVLVMPAGLLALAAVYVFRDAEGTPFLELLVYGFGGYLLAMVLIRALLRPPRPAVQITPLEDSLAHALARRLEMLTLLIFLGMLLAKALKLQELPETVFYLIRAGVVTLLAVNLGWLLWLLGRIKRLGIGRRLRLVLLLVLLVAVGGEWLGYRNLSSYLMRGMLGTLAVGGVFWLLSALAKELFDELDSGHSAWQQRLRRTLALGPEEPIPGLLWLRVLVWIVSWGGATLLLLQVWGLSDAGFALIIEYLVDGFEIGNFRIVPSKVLGGLLLFAVLLLSARWIRDRLDQKLRNRTRLDAGSRDALVSLTGYLGFGAAILFGLSMAGVDLSNIAIIAGALSVGIGFGLQNIVNNFVSGIILLFERPIRPGDWIVVGNTEGYVKKVRVRATEIQTFDRSDVIVPNSELISGQVTNWTYRDPYGRVICRVGVAYGSDVQQVRQLLLDVAKAHPQVLTDGRTPPPRVIFQDFGDSALVFELRCYVRDVTNRLAIKSDLNFAIDEAFRKHRVQIPFPQRDIYIKSPPAADEPPPPPDGERAPHQA
jgi:small-conductance mechanosensitive channel